MFLWRTRPPSAVLAALTRLMTIRERRQATHGPASGTESDEGGKGQERLDQKHLDQKRLDEAVTRVQPRL